MNENPDDPTNKAAASLLFDLCEDYHGGTFQALCRAAVMLEMIPDGLTPEAVQWAVKIAAETINCRTTDEPAALTRFYDAWDSLTPSVRAALTQGGEG